MFNEAFVVETDVAASNEESWYPVTNTSFFFFVAWSPLDNKTVLLNINQAKEGQENLNGHL